MADTADIKGNYNDEFQRVELTVAAFQGPAGFEVFYVRLQTPFLRIPELGGMTFRTLVGGPAEFIANQLGQDFRFGPTYLIAQQDFANRLRAYRVSRTYNEVPINPPVFSLRRHLRER